MQLVNGRYVDAESPEKEPAPELVAAGREPVRANRWLVVALLVAVAVAGALAGLRYLEHRQTPDERAVVELVDQNRRAWEAGDVVAVLKTMTPNGTWAEGSLTGRVTEGPYSGAELAGFVRQMDLMGFHTDRTGRAAVLAGAKDWTVVLPTRVSFTSGGTVTEQPGWMLVTVVDLHGTKLISSEFFWPTSTNTSATG